MSSINVLLLDRANTLVIKKKPNDRFFITTTDSIIIGVDGFITLLNHLVQNDVINPKVLKGILEEYYTE